MVKPPNTDSSVYPVAENVNWSVPSPPTHLSIVDEQKEEHIKTIDQTINQLSVNVSTTIKWYKPLINGGANIDEYEVEYCQMEKHDLHYIEEVGEHQYLSIQSTTANDTYHHGSSSSSSSHQPYMICVGNLRPCTLYRFTVRAKNVRGWSTNNTNTGKN